MIKLVPIPEMTGMRYTPHEILTKLEAQLNELDQEGYEICGVSDGIIFMAKTQHAPIMMNLDNGQ